MARRLVDAVESIPVMAGGSPLYDAIALAWAQELRQRPGERNALVVLSDGVDNRLAAEAYAQAPSTARRRKSAQPRSAPPGVLAAMSNLTFEGLLEGVELMDALVYPFMLQSDGGGRSFPGEISRQAAEQMQALAQASGGRVVEADSIEDVSAYEELVRDMRSVYTIAVRPANANLDGGWRALEVRVRNPELRVRARPGYFAR